MYELEYESGMRLDIFTNKKSFFMYDGEMNYSQRCDLAFLSSSLIQIITLRYNLLKLGALDIPSAFPFTAIPHNKHVIKTHFTGSHFTNPLAKQIFLSAPR